VRVPDLVGERFGRAVKQVGRIGLKQEAPHFTGTVGNPHYNGRCQRVLNQSPPAGTRVPKGFTVAIVYGVCPKSIFHGHSSLAHPPKH
jgi:beta-lactam-binding protein with PASTA domain